MRADAANLRDRNGPHPHLGIRAVNAMLSQGINPYAPGSAAKAASQLSQAGLTIIPNLGVKGRNEVLDWLKAEGFEGFCTIEEVRKKITATEKKIAQLENILSGLKRTEMRLL